MDLHCFINVNQFIRIICYCVPVGHHLHGADDGMGIGNTLPDALTTIALAKKGYA